MNGKARSAAGMGKRLRALLAQQGEEIRQEVERLEDVFTDKGMENKNACFKLSQSAGFGHIRCFFVTFWQEASLYI